MTEPISGSKLFNALKDEETIIMACNTRTTVGVVKGIFRAAKELDAVVMMELAKSESDLNGGYTGITPAKYAEETRKYSSEVGFDSWALHADHITMKKGTPEEIEETKKLIAAQVDAGFTSFAIDASFLFNSEGETVEEQLAENIRVTIELAKFIEEKMGDKEFGLECEVGEIGKKDSDGRILTKPEEAVAFVKALEAAGVKPHGIAIANGSAHGNTYDAEGKLIEQVSIDIPQTIKVAEALKGEDSNVRVVQHGITGTPLDLIASKFPKKAIIKGNVGTEWQNVAWSVLEEKEPELYKEIQEWVMEKYGEEAKRKGLKSEVEIFGKYSKKAWKPFYEKVHALKPETVKAIEEKAYSRAKQFFEAFGAVGSGEKVRNYRG